MVEMVKMVRKVMVSLSMVVVKMVRKVMVRGRMIRSGEEVHALENEITAKQRDRILMGSC